MHVLAHGPVNFIIGYLYFALTGQPYNLEFLIAISVAGMLIDFDHILTFVLLKKSVHPGAFLMWVRHQLDKKIARFYLCHTFEFIGLLYVFSNYSYLAKVMFIGYALHFAVDIAVNLRYDIVNGRAFMHRFKYWLGSYHFLYPRINYIRIRLISRITSV
ncbi:MAG: hypothetical protein KAJ54_01175 [Candidatus Aenigmarchaeota archaeon]|nr:hypothetical protein [Candidatus Aenigmarchaeota archaeon]